ncbi:hypothetical protein K458DRAFT_419262 [Lentithecium fluviatile CBS 122367]|uniref:Uncharacterized protein n=1 Tax=Lentithecium fluviatile CBS 122367 TaxID=1168545 RepID=A0A6G1IYS0_9PLEO|nr:hypothetical protein K458DRAFT_419262 [Lentithecium fluviatile CBS 122367]
MASPSHDSDVEGLESMLDTNAAVTKRILFNEPTEFCPDSSRPKRRKGDASKPGHKQERNTRTKKYRDDKGCQGAAQLRPPSSSPPSQLHGAGCKPATFSFALPLCHARPMRSPFYAASSEMREERPRRRSPYKPLTLRPTPTSELENFGTHIPAKEAVCDQKTRGSTCSAPDKQTPLEHNNNVRLTGSRLNSADKTEKDAMGPVPCSQLGLLVKRRPESKNEDVDEVGEHVTNGYHRNNIEAVNPIAPSSPKTRESIEDGTPPTGLPPSTPSVTSHVDELARAASARSSYSLFSDPVLSNPVLSNPVLSHSLSSHSSPVDASLDPLPKQTMSSSQDETAASQLVKSLVQRSVDLQLEVKEEEASRLAERRNRTLNLQIDKLQQKADKKRSNRETKSDSALAECKAALRSSDKECAELKCELGHTEKQLQEVQQELREIKDSLAPTLRLEYHGLKSANEVLQQRIRNAEASLGQRELDPVNALGFLRGQIEKVEQEIHRSSSLPYHCEQTGRFIERRNDLTYIHNTLLGMTRTDDSRTRTDIFNAQQLEARDQKIRELTARIDRMQQAMDNRELGDQGGGLGMAVNAGPTTRRAYPIPNGGHPPNAGPATRSAFPFPNHGLPPYPRAPRHGLPMSAPVHVPTVSSQAGETMDQNALIGALLQLIQANINGRIPDGSGGNHGRNVMQDTELGEAENGEGRTRVTIKIEEASENEGERR